ncbi:MAG: hypothetical protein CBB68_03530 [Rhodospirillaceae bacterium TMED8]|nr:gamma-glutamylcyclotransferase [Magnetovibrio sp.]OUT51955.1 MAG: hypothetical protein CBB68_03530 [Rhodospirillaceae bacterium TMED8]|tara:strand:+ start:605 stop:1243 length:639 start_codon:yes stop_codon:yes gene_type:complete
MNNGLAFHKKKQKLVRSFNACATTGLQFKSALFEEPNIEWIFGYGSLMWDPGFRYIEKCPALLHGFNRSFCIYSHHHRGTRTCPGLVVGLDQGGNCQGSAFRIETQDMRDVISYLDKRELIGYAYRPANVPLYLANNSLVIARTYIADRTHPQFAGALCPSDSANLISRAKGISGSNWDYALNLVKMLKNCGIFDAHLLEVFDCLRISLRYD